jgi:hypothetical protein
VSQDTLEQLYVTEALTIRQVADRLGVGEATVSAALRSYGIPVSLRPPRRRPAREILEDLYLHQGLSAREIAQRYGVHPNTPWLWLATAGIPRRPAGRRRSEESHLASSSDAHDDALLKPGDVAALFGVNPRTVACWARLGRLPGAVRTPGGQRRYRWGDVANLLARHRHVDGHDQAHGPLDGPARRHARPDPDPEPADDRAELDPAPAGGASPFVQGL